MCMWFFQNPAIIFYHFFRIFNLDIFLVLILQKSIGSRYFVPQFLADPFETLHGLLEINFYYFLHILNIDIFCVLILQKRIGNRYLVPLTPPTGFGRSF